MKNFSRLQVLFILILCLLITPYIIPGNAYAEDVGGIKIVNVTKTGDTKPIGSGQPSGVLVQTRTGTNLSRGQLKAIGSATSQTKAPSSSNSIQAQLAHNAMFKGYDIHVDSPHAGTVVVTVIQKTPAPKK